MSTGMIFMCSQINIFLLLLRGTTRAMPNLKPSEAKRLQSNRTSTVLYPINAPLLSSLKPSVAFDHTNLSLTLMLKTIRFICSSHDRGQVLRTFSIKSMHLPSHLRTTLPSVGLARKSSTAHVFATKILARAHSEPFLSTVTACIDR